MILKAGYSATDSAGKEYSAPESSIEINSASVQEELTVSSGTGSSGGSTYILSTSFPGRCSVAVQNVGPVDILVKYTPADDSADLSGASTTAGNIVLKASGYQEQGEFVLLHGVDGAQNLLLYAAASSGKVRVGVADRDA